MNAFTMNRKPLALSGTSAGALAGWELRARADKASTKAAVQSTRSRTGSGRSFDVAAEHSKAIELHTKAAEAHDAAAEATPETERYPTGATKRSYHRGAADDHRIQIKRHTKELEIAKNLAGPAK
jgi:hypothetical protein